MNCRIESAEELSRRLVGFLGADFRFDPMGQFVEAIEADRAGQRKAGALAALDLAINDAYSNQWHNQSRELVGLRCRIESGAWKP